MPILVVCLSVAIAKNRLLKGMKKHEEVQCRCLAVPKSFEGSYETTFAMQVSANTSFRIRIPP